MRAVEERERLDQPLDVRVLAAVGSSGSRLATFGILAGELAAELAEVAQLALVVGAAARRALRPPGRGVAAARLDHRVEGHGLAHRVDAQHGVDAEAQRALVRLRAARA